MCLVLQTEVLWWIATKYKLFPWQVEEPDSNSGSDFRDGSLSPSAKQPLTNGPSPCQAIEPTMPHGACRDKCRDDAETAGGILHPRHTSCSCEETSTMYNTDGDGKAGAKVHDAV